MLVRHFPAPGGHRSIFSQETYLNNRLIDPALMRMFVYLSEEGTFTSVAERLSLTQQAVSAQMRRLEELTGRVLVKRNYHKVELTHDGDALLVTAKQIVELSERLQRQFSSMPLEGVIRLGFNLGVAPSMLFPLMSELRRSHPRLEVRCQTAPSEQLLARLQAGSLDIVLGAQRAGDLRGEIIRKERLVWVGDIDNLVKPGKPVALVMLPSPAFIREHIFDVLSKAGLHWTVHTECDDASTMKAAILAGWGISLFNEEMLAGDPDFPGHAEMGALPDPGHIEFFMNFSSNHDNELIDSMAAILRSTLSYP